MNHLHRFAFVLTTSALAFVACSDDDPDTPPPVVPATTTTTTSGTGAGGSGGGSTTSAGGMGGDGGMAVGGMGGMGGMAAGGTGGTGGTGGSGGSPPDGELTINGDFETGDTTGWESFAAANNGTFAATMAEENGGMWSGNLVAAVPNAGDPASFPVVKQANLGVGTVQPNQTLTVTFDLFGSIQGAGGVVFAEFFSELSGGGTSKAEILTGGPLFPNAPNDWTAGWVTYQFTVTTGPDVSGGVTLQLKADCGANVGCEVDVYFDNASVTVQ